MQRPLKDLSERSALMEAVCLEPREREGLVPVANLPLFPGLRVPLDCNLHEDREHAGLLASLSLPWRAR